MAIVAAVHRRVRIAGGRLAAQARVRRGIGVAVVAGMLIYISATQWLLDPGFGPVVLRHHRRRHRLGVDRRDGRHGATRKAPLHAP